MARKSKSPRKNLRDPIDRRDFLKRSGLGLAMVVAGDSSYARREEQRAARIVPGKIPERVPGKLPMKWADEAMIRQAAELHPFDLQRRMNIAVNARTTCVDPDLGYLSYAEIHFDNRPPLMLHTVGDLVDDTGRHTDSLWLNRSATNDHTNDDVVHKITENAMDVVDQGLAWNPQSAPYAVAGHEQEQIGRWTDLPETSRMFLGLVTYYGATGNPRALSTLRAMMRRHFEIAEKDDRYLWFPHDIYIPVGTKVLPWNLAHGEKVDVRDPHSASTGMVGLMLLPVVRYYEVTKDPLAADFSIKYSRLIVELMPDFVNTIEHTHSRLAMISGVLMAGQVLGVPEFEEWAEETYQRYTQQDFIPDFGWTPERTSRKRVAGHLCCETCSTVDYLELALQLAQYRNEKYWDHVERIAMNQLLEGQMLRTDFVERIPSATTKLPNVDTKWSTTDSVMNRALGGFASFSGPNDWVQTRDLIWTVQCCVGSGPRGLYDAWYYAAQEQGDTVKVNLQFSKRLPSAVITSYMPGKAMVEIEMTQGKKLRVRKPGWASAEQSRIVVDGKKKKASLAGTYFDMGYLQAGTKVRVEFPDQTVRKTERIGEVEFRTVWRGNAVVEMEPAGEIYPLYQGRNRQNGVMPLPFVNSLPVNPL